VPFRRHVRVSVRTGLKQDAGCGGARDLHRGLMWLFTGLGLMVFLFGTALTAHQEISASDRVSRANLAKERGATEEQILEILNDRQQSGILRRSL
jgi:hypothetical protein